MERKSLTSLWTIQMTVMMPCQKRAVLSPPSFKINQKRIWGGGLFPMFESFEGVKLDGQSGGRKVGGSTLKNWAAENILVYRVIFHDIWRSWSTDRSPQIFIWGGQRFSLTTRILWISWKSCWRKQHLRRRSSNSTWCTTIRWRKGLVISAQGWKFHHVSDI